MGIPVPENKAEVTSKVYIGFIDILFAIVVGVSFTDFKQILVPIAFKFETFTLLLAYVTVISSWIGYHIAIDKKPDRSLYRFIIDLIILYLYFYLIYSVQNFSIVVVMFPIIFGFYILWDFAREMEEYTAKMERFRNTGILPRPRIVNYVFHSIWGSRWNKVNTIFFILFILQFVVFHILGNITFMQQRIILDGGLLEWYIWITSMTMLVLYRWLKEVPSMLRTVTVIR